MLRTLVSALLGNQFESRVNFSRKNKVFLMSDYPAVNKRLLKIISSSRQAIVILTPQGKYFNPVSSQVVIDYAMLIGSTNKIYETFLNIFIIKI